MESFDRGDREHKRDDNPISQQATTTQFRSNIPSGRLAETFTVGAGAHSVPRPIETPTASFVTQAPAVAATHDTTELPMPAMARSIVFEVVQPDLGRINVRVAMTNDMVHTHLSSDRSEVGQFLINGQDRLQAALQANGLDMGQFRVDIDRHSAGRSFQQEHPRDQGQTWYQNASRTQDDSAPEPHDVRLARPYSMVNLVA
jgi:flagellar hook-length control protein FliK